MEKLRSWHVFSDSIQNTTWKYDSNHIYISPIAQSMRNAWNISHPHKEKYFLHTKSYQQLRFDEAIDIIYKHQHPIDCSNTYYLVSQGFDSGFGSEFHVESYGLALAMESNRTYVSSVPSYQRNYWKVNIPECRGRKDHLSCYFELWSNCSTYIMNKGTTRVVKSTMEETIEPYSIHHPDDWFVHLNMLRDQGLRMLIPYQLRPLVESLPIQPHLRFYWWRAVAMSYLMRINQMTIDYLNRLRIPNVKQLNGHCVSMYVRHGDKGREMKLVPFKNYSDVAVEMWNSYMLTRSSSDHEHSINKKPTLVLGTETKYILDEAVEWAKQNNWDLLYNPLQPQLFNNPKHEYAYLVMIANLADLMSCDVQVCTLNSNYCRVLDILRVTMGVKPYAPFIDFSPGTCRDPPCGMKRSSGDDFITFDW